MRLRLDNSKCQGHGRCYALAPELFESDDEGYAVLKVEGDLEPGQQDGAVLAADNCPEYAIEVDL